jgi:hypothetical protein
MSKVVKHRCICGKFKDSRGIYYQVCIRHWANKKWIKGLIKERATLKEC